MVYRWMEDGYWELGMKDGRWENEREREGKGGKNEKFDLEFINLKFPLDNANP